MQSLLDVIKSKRFWGGVFTALGGVLAGSLAIPDAIIQLIHMFGG